MADRDINIRLKLTDEFTNGMAKVNREVDKMADTMLRQGRQLSRFGNQMMWIGTAVLAPFILAIKEYSKHNIYAEEKLNKLTRTFQEFQVNLAVYALPYLDRLNDIIGKVNQKFNQISPSTKNVVADVVIMIGVITLLSGVIVKVAGAIEILSSVFVRFSPLIIGIGVAFAGWKTGEWISNITGLNEALSGRDGLFTKMFEWLDRKDIAGKLANFINKVKDLTIIAGSFGLIKPPKVSVETDDYSNWDRITVTKSVSMVMKMKETFKQIGTGFKEQVIQMNKDLDNFGQMGKETALKIEQAMETHLGNFFYNTLTGQLKSAKEMFADFGRAVLQILTQMIAKIIIIRSLGMMFGGGAGSLLTLHSGGVVRRAHSGMYAPDEVPIIAQQGEGIISRRGMNRLGVAGFNKLNRGEGGSGMTLNYSPVIVIKAFDTNDVYAQRKAISGVLSEDLMNNGTMRRMLKQYGR